MPFTDPKKKAAYKKLWREKNKEKFLSQNRKHQETYRQKHPEKYDRQSKRLTKHNKENWMRLHGLGDMIGKSNEEIESAIKRVQKQLFRKTQNRYRRKISQQIKAYLLDFKKKHPCERCLESDPCCLDFHHIDEKTKRDAMNNLLQSSMKAVLEEIKKCQILCSNCHRKHHHYARMSKLNKKGPL